MNCQKKIVDTPSTVKRSSTHFSQERLRGGVVIFFTTVQKVHRVIKLYEILKQSIAMQKKIDGIYRSFFFVRAGIVSFSSPRCKKFIG